MSYNLKNNNIVMIAVAIAAIMTISPAAYAQTADNQINAEAPAPQVHENDDLFGLDEPADGTPAETSSDAASENAVADETAVPAPITDENSQTQAESAPQGLADVDKAADEAQPAEENNKEVQPSNVDLNSIPDTSTDEGKKSLEAATSDSDEQVAIEAPKSPFENFGNAILSKVDNSLFNQMSNIEKQTTILNLEYKREEVRNRIEALRIQRLKAQQEEASRLKEEENRAKDEENKRKIKEIEAQEKLKRAEMELEKIRQAKVLNEYMNEMLIVNQQWVEKNAALQSKVKELRDERKALIKDFEDKISTVKKESDATILKAQNAKEAHNKVVSSLQTQISSLKKAIIQSEDTINQLKSGNGNSANPFAEGIDENAIDMSDEYAIMDITGKGNDIIAKIINKDGTTFIVHQGSMLKGGEVVMAITDNYIAFDNKGVKSYLYTGGTVREYEPENSFNGADKTPVAAQGVVNNNNVVRNVRGAPITQQAGSNLKEATGAAVAKPQNKGAADKKETINTAKRSSTNASIGSIGQDMFVK